MPPPKFLAVKKILAAELPARVPTKSQTAKDPPNEKVSDTNMIPEIDGHIHPGGNQGHPYHMKEKQKAIYRMKSRSK